jgi:hypothetical protein
MKLTSRQRIEALRQQVPTLEIALACPGLEADLAPAHGRADEFVTFAADIVNRLRQQVVLELEIALTPDLGAVFALAHEADEFATFCRRIVTAPSTTFAAGLARDNPLVLDDPLELVDYPEVADEALERPTR